VLAAIRPLAEGDTDTLRLLSQNLAKRFILDSHEEVEDIASDATAEATEDSLLRVNVKRRAFLLVKGTKSSKILAHATQDDELRDDIDDI